MQTLLIQAGTAALGEITTADSVALTDLLHSDGHEQPRAGLTARQARLDGKAYMLPSVSDRQLDLADLT